VGNSLGVTVPADFVKDVGIRMGDQVNVEKKPEKGEVIYRFSGIKQLAIAENLPGKDENKDG